MEGTKTLAYELWEQAGFRAPDNVVVPLGYGSNVLGAERGFDELVRIGEIARRPRLFGVQAARCAPYAAAFRAGVEHLVASEIAPTLAEGIATAKPTSRLQTPGALEVSQPNNRSSMEALGTRLRLKLSKIRHRLMTLRGFRSQPPCAEGTRPSIHGAICQSPRIQRCWRLL